MSRAQAQLRLDGFRRRHGAALHLFACHAALPVVLNPEIVHLLRVNYFLDPPDPLPYEAEAQLLLSALCHEVDDGLYAMDPDVRDLLLEHLVEHQGNQRLKDVARMLWEYGRRGAPWHGRAGLAEAQQLTALNFLEPQQALDWLTRAEAGAGPGRTDARWFVAMRRDLQDRAVAVERAEERAGAGSTMVPALLGLRDALAAAYPDRAEALALARTAGIPDPEIRLDASPVAIWQQLVDAAWVARRLPALFLAVRPHAAIAQAVQEYWIRMSPALSVRDGRMAEPPPEWQILASRRGQIARTLSALCVVVTPGAPDAGRLMGYLAGPRTVIVKADAPALSLDLPHAGSSVVLAFADQHSRWPAAGTANPANPEGIGAFITEIRQINGHGLVAMTVRPDPGAESLMPSPLVAAGAPPDLIGRQVYVVGYPATTDQQRSDPAVVSRILGTDGGVLRVQPGEVVGVSGEGLDATITHTCFTMPGNSGSPLVDLATGEVLGVHFAARYDPGPTGLKEAHAVALWPAAADESLVRAGVFGTPAAPSVPAPTPRTVVRRPEVITVQATTNPFQIPGQTRAGAPLCPWRIPGDIDLYVDVDSTGTSFDHFRSRSADAAAVARNGLFAVAYGGELCGKTALLNRCAAVLFQALDRAGYRPVVVDVTWSGQGTTAMRDRLASIGSALSSELWRAGVVRERDLLDAVAERPNQALDYLSLALGPENVAIVLLPPSDDLIDELAEFSRQIRGQVVLLGETAWGNRLVQHPYFADPRRAVVQLPVGPLGPDDAWLFVRDRLDRPERIGLGGVPEIRRETVEAITRIRPMSVGELQLLLHSAYEEWAQASPPPPEITRNFLAELYIRRTQYI